MVILRGCARCGGDVLTRDAKNVRCLQCGYRPEMPIAALRRHARRSAQGRASGIEELEALFGAEFASDAAEDKAGEVSDAALGERCPRCEEVDLVALDKLRPHFNTCYRCQLCGHIFSPAVFRAAS